MNNKKGKLIIIEGADGIGKTTLVNEIKNLYGDKFKYFREPGGCEESEMIRNSIFELATKTSDTDKLFMFHTSRIILWYKHLKPLLDEGFNIIIDRFYLSTIIYENCLGSYDKIIDELIKEYKDNILNIVLTTKLITEKMRDKEENSFDKKYNKHIINENYLRFLNNLNNGCKITKYRYEEVPMVYYNDDTDRSIKENLSNVIQHINKFIKEDNDGR